MYARALRTIPASAVWQTRTRVALLGPEVSANPLLASTAGTEGRRAPDVLRRVLAGCRNIRLRGRFGTLLDCRLGDGGGFSPFHLSMDISPACGASGDPFYSPAGAPSQGECSRPWGCDGAIGLTLQVLQNDVAAVLYFFQREVRRLVVRSDDGRRSVEISMLPKNLLTDSLVFLFQSPSSPPRVPAAFEDGRLHVSRSSSCTPTRPTCRPPRP